jgi:hypothetical protein
MQNRSPECGLFPIVARPMAKKSALRDAIETVLAYLFFASVGAFGIICTMYWLAA